MPQELDKNNEEELDIKSLQEEVESFRREKESIRKLVGQIGGVQFEQRDRVINIIFIVALVTLLLGDVLRHVFDMKIPLPALFSLELGVLMVSIKIIWMIHNQTKVFHFQFWILNSIEFRLNDLSKRLARIEKENKKK